MKGNCLNKLSDFIKTSGVINVLSMYIMDTCGNSKESPNLKILTEQIFKAAI